jgi:OOP family OmpA-OmpF porin
MKEDNMQFRITSAVVLAAALAGCVSAPLSELRESTPRGSEVSKALAHEYAQFAAVEVTEMVDLKDGDYFARKGLQAARGGEPVPEVVSSWRLPVTEVRHLQLERNRLVAALANRPEEAAPKAAAAAQVGYDCWIEQKEEGFQPGDIEHCRARFLASVDSLEQRKDYPHSVFFNFNATRLKPADTARIRALAAKAMRLGVPRITVLGHADSVGSERYNLGLSLRRADVVSRALIVAGIAPEQLGIAAAGETKPRISTNNGIAEPQNRRVEVLFQPAEAW